MWSLCAYVVCVYICGLYTYVAHMYTHVKQQHPWLELNSCPASPSPGGGSQAICRHCPRPPQPPAASPTPPPREKHGFESWWRGNRALHAIPGFFPPVLYSRSPLESPASLLSLKIRYIPDTWDGSCRVSPPPAPHSPSCLACHPVTEKKSPSYCKRASSPSLPPMALPPILPSRHCMWAPPSGQGSLQADTPVAGSSQQEGQ